MSYQRHGSRKPGKHEYLWFWLVKQTCNARLMAQRNRLILAGIVGLAVSLFFIIYGGVGTGVEREYEHHEGKFWAFLWVGIALFLVSASSLASGLYIRANGPIKLLRSRVAPDMSGQSADTVRNQRTHQGHRHRSEQRSRRTQQQQYGQTTQEYASVDSGYVQGDVQQHWPAQQVHSSRSQAHSPRQMPIYSSPAEQQIYATPQRQNLSHQNSQNQPNSHYETPVSRHPTSSRGRRPRTTRRTHHQGHSGGSGDPESGAGHQHPSTGRQLEQVEPSTLPPVGNIFIAAPNQHVIILERPPTYEEAMNSPTSPSSGPSLPVLHSSAYNDRNQLYFAKRFTAV